MKPAPNYLLAVAKLCKAIWHSCDLWWNCGRFWAYRNHVSRLEQMLALADDSEKDALCPDFICLSKGLTAGYFMSHVMTTDNASTKHFMMSALKRLLHSHSFTGNPLACAAALASLQVFAHDKVIDHNQQLSHAMHDDFGGAQTRGFCYLSYTANRHDKCLYFIGQWGKCTTIIKFLSQKWRHDSPYRQSCLFNSAVLHHRADWASIWYLQKGLAMLVTTATENDLPTLSLP